MPATTPGFLAAHAARGNRNLLLLGLFLTALGAGLSWLFSNPYGFLFVGGPGLIALGVWADRRFRPERHPNYPQLAPFGDAAALAEEVDREFAGAPVDTAAQFGAGWLAQGDTYGVRLVPWREVAWLHMYTHKTNGVPAHYVRVWTRDGRVIAVPSGADQMGMLERLSARAPWAEVGWSDDRMTEWQKARAEVLARVDARRALMPPSA